MPAPASETPGHRGVDGVAESAPRRERVVHGRRLVAAVHHAVAALVVAAPPPVVFPAGGLEQRREARGVPFLAEIAGALPAKDVVGRITPPPALAVLLTHEEVEEQRGLVEPPAPRRMR